MTTTEQEPTSRVLFRRGFKTLDDAMRCSVAAYTDEDAKRIRRAEAEKIRAAVRRWIDANERRA